MKKTIIALIISTALLFTLTGCTTKLDKLIGAESTIRIETDEITLKVKEDTLTKNGATFVLENNRKEVINYNAAYTIEVKRDNVWHEINIINEFVDETYEVDPKSTDQITVDWKDSYLKLPKGEYRLIKEVTVPDTLELFYVASEFTIK